MIFKHPHLLKEKEIINPDLRATIEELDRYSTLCHLPQLTITCLMRSPDGNSQLYYELYKRLRDGSPATTGEQFEIKKAVDGLTDDQLREKANGRKSWHCVGRAVDIRSRDYSKKQLDDVVKKLHRIAFAFNYGIDEYELLVHDVTAPHIHFALKPRKETTQNG